MQLRRQHGSQLQGVAGPRAKRQPPPSPTTNFTRQVSTLCRGRPGKAPSSCGTHRLADPALRRLPRPRGGRPRHVVRQRPRFPQSPCPQVPPRPTSLFSSPSHIAFSKADVIKQLSSSNSTSIAPVHGIQALTWVCCTVLNIILADRCQNSFGSDSKTDRRVGERRRRNHRGGGSSGERVECGRLRVHEGQSRASCAARDAD